ncbi:hypothetical protein KBI52_01460, partial [Microvirga sp. HBU67558]|nr:hypothetical protein [Microvirga sp. HBU67558]
DHNSWDAGVSLSSADFQSLDSKTAVGARAADGSLPDSNFLLPASGSDLIDRGVSTGLTHTDSAPDLVSSYKVNPSVDGYLLTL